MSGAPSGLILGDGLVCEGLEGPVGERTVLGVPLAEHQQASFAGGGLRDGERLVAAADVAFSAAAVRAAVRAGRAAGRDTTFVPDAVSGRAICALTGEAPGLTWLVGGGTDDVAERVRSAPVAPISAEEREVPGFALPDGPLVVADAWVLPVRHWAQLLWVNLLGLGPHLWSALVGHGPMAGVRLGWGAMRALSVRPEVVAAGFVRLGAGAFVHPSATVEATVLGAGARIGAGAVVRGAVLGAGAVVEELALVEGVVLGPGARVQRQGMAKFMVLEAEAAHGGDAQLGVLGRGAQVKKGATLMDMAFGQDVRVSVAGRLVPAPHRLCGVCVGVGGTVGSGVWVAPGRALPTGLAVVADPDRVLRRVQIPTGITRAVVRSGALEPDDALG